MARASSVAPAANMANNSLPRMPLHPICLASSVAPASVNQGLREQGSLRERSPWGFAGKTRTGKNRTGSAGKNPVAEAPPPPRMLETLCLAQQSGVGQTDGLCLAEQRKERKTLTHRGLWVPPPPRILSLAEQRKKRKTLTHRFLLVPPPPRMVEADGLCRRLFFLFLPFLPFLPFLTFAFACGEGYLRFFRFFPFKAPLAHFGNSPDNLYSL